MSEEPPLTLSTLLRGTGSLVGISTGDAAGTVIATIQRDGITAFDIATQERKVSWVLGSSRWSFLTPAVYCGFTKAYAAVVAEGPVDDASAAELWVWPCSSSGAVSLERAAARTRLPPGSVHSLHSLLSGQGAPGADGPVSPAALGAGAAPTDRDGVEAAGSAGDADGGADSLAVVLSDGAVYSISLPAAGDDQETAVMVRLAEAPCGAGVSVAAAASGPSGGSLAVIVGGAGSEAVAHIHSPQASAKSYSFQLPPPAAGAEVRRGALRDKRMALLWSDGTLQTYDIGTSAARRAAAAPQPETGVSLQLRGFALTAPQAQPAPVEAKTPKKKRKALPDGSVANGIVAPPPQPPASPALALLPGDHAVVVGWEAAGNGSSAPASGGRLRAVVLELRYGSLRSLAASPAAGSPAAPPQALALGGVGGEEGLVVIAAGGALLTTPVEMAPVTLASVLGALALGPQWPAADASPAARAAAAALAPGGLPAALQGGTAAPPPDYRTAQEDLAAAAAAGAFPGGRLLRRVPLRDSTGVERDPLPDASAELLARLAVGAGEAPSPAAATTAAHAAAAAGDALRPDAAGAAAAVCAERGHWKALDALVQGGLLTSLRVAPALASVLLEAGRLRPFAELLARASDMSTPELRRLLRLLLRQRAAAADAAPASLASAAQALAAELQKAAEAAVAAAEAAGGRKPAELSAAAAAAATVEGFLPEELCLHPLVAAHTDSVVILEAAQGLAPGQALALLRYLATWLRLHADVLGGWLHPPRRHRAGRGASGGGRRSQQQQVAAGSDSGSGAAVQSGSHPQAEAAAQSGPADSISSGRSSGRTTRGRAAKGNTAAAASNSSQPEPTSATETSSPGAAQKSDAAGVAPMEVDAAEPQGPAAADGAAGGGGNAAGYLAAGWPVPPLARVVEWASAVLDAQLAGLAPNAATRQVLEGMRGAVEGQAAEAGRLLRLRGGVEHLRSGAPLPAQQDAASLYTLERLDLSRL